MTWFLVLVAFHAVPASEMDATSSPTTMSSAEWRWCEKGLQLSSGCDASAE